MKQKKILLIDHEDSFTYNIVHSLASEQVSLEVIHFLDPKLDQDFVLAFDGLVLSAGPGRPEDSKRVNALLPDIYEKLPILGICLGYQLLGCFFGAALGYAKELVHGRAYAMHHQKTGLFSDLASPVMGMRYHSLCLEEKNWPTFLQIDARLACGAPMAFSHCHLPIFGVQFHPESVGSPDGQVLMDAFIEAVSKKNEFSPSTLLVS